MEIVKQEFSEHSAQLSRKILKASNKYREIAIFVSLDRMKTLFPDIVSEHKKEKTFGFILLEKKMDLYSYPKCESIKKLTKDEFVQCLSILFDSEKPFTILFAEGWGCGTEHKIKTKKDLKVIKLYV